MASFIHDVLADLQKRNLNISELIFVLPSKRAGVFLKEELSKLVTQPLFAPEIYSIEAFIETLSQLRNISNIELLFEFYKSYKNLTPSEDLDDFSTFSKWAQVVLQDFNEIDRYLIPPKHVFDYLSAIQDINHEHWSLEEPHTPLIKKHLAFWRKLWQYYSNFTETLLERHVGYQGLIYKEAVGKTAAYLQEHSKHHVFLGFNALNTAETEIIQMFLDHGNASIYWDIDQHFLDTYRHDAGLFIQAHRKQWKYFEKHPFYWTSNYYTQPKHIEIIGTPKNIGQAKYIGSLLKRLQQTQGLQNTALVLGNESLLFPILNSIPDVIPTLNITMGFPLRMVPLSSLFDQLFLLHKDDSATYYYKDVIGLLSHPSIKALCIEEDINHADLLVQYIQENNLVFLNLPLLERKVVASQKPLIKLLFTPWNNQAQFGLEQCQLLIVAIKNYLEVDRDQHRLALEYLYKFHTVFNSLLLLHSNYPYVNSIKALYSLYKEVLSTETLDFQGEPLKGLQIMGMLESRVLDFDTVIIAGVNEGILPAGKSNNSFIPYDVKTENGLPTYKEKDAVYTYHFYRLLQRAKQVHILYNTEPDVLEGGEKSRFITQMEIEGIHPLHQKIVTPITPQIQQRPKEISKSEAVMEKLKAVALKGFSPSSLTSYIRNPIDFYYQRILGIKDYEVVEETIAANTLGTVIHNTLEDFYIPYLNQELQVDMLKGMKTKIEDTVQKHFKREYKEGTITKGKNLIIFEIAKRYVSNFIDYEMSQIKAGHSIYILALEAEHKVALNIPQLNFPVNLIGTVDRIDRFDDTLRIIDYKTGKVEQNKVEIVDWEDLNTDYTKYSKSFQVLMYAYMLSEQEPFSQPPEAGIISFKNLKNGFLKFGKKDGPRSRKKQHEITPEILEAFKEQMESLIVEICDENTSFIEKPV